MERGGPSHLPSECSHFHSPHLNLLIWVFRALWRGTPSKRKRSAADRAETRPLRDNPPQKTEPSAISPRTQLPLWVLSRFSFHACAATCVWENRLSLHKLSYGWLNRVLVNSLIQTSCLYCNNTFAIILKNFAQLHLESDTCVFLRADFIKPHSMPNLLLFRLL